MGKLGLFLSVIMTGVLAISIVTNIYLHTVNNQLNEELSELRQVEFQTYEYTYTLPQFRGHWLENETQEHASTVWKKVKEFDEAKFVISEKNFSVIVYIHPYTVGGFDPSIAEWVVIVSSIPEMTSKEARIAIFRLDYQTFLLKKAYKFGYPADDEFTLEESMDIMEEEMTNDPYWSRSVNREEVQLLGGNYIYSYPAMDFGGTIIVNKYIGMVIFYATTVWDGAGRLIIPEE